MELGIYTFGETDPRRTDDSTVVARRIRVLIEEIVLADQVGLDVFGVGEHHRPDYVISTPAVVLAAAASRTSRIRLTSAVTVLSSDDPVRVFQDFATLDLISGGRAEIMAGRGSFIESYPLFGQDLADYDALFAEKLELLLALRQRERITWQGTHRPSIDDRGVYPRPLQQPLPVWIAVGGTPQSVVRAGTLGLPLAIAIIGGMPERFVAFADLYREAGAKAGHDPSTLKVSINSHGLIADTTAQAVDAASRRISIRCASGTERGGRCPRDSSSIRALRRAMLLGDPQEVIDKILFDTNCSNTTARRQFSVGSMKHADIMRSIELFGTRVAPSGAKHWGASTDPSGPRQISADASSVVRWQIPVSFGSASSRALSPRR